MVFSCHICAARSYESIIPALRDWNICSAFGLVIHHSLDTGECKAGISLPAARRQTTNPQRFGEGDCCSTTCSKGFTHVPEVVLTTDFDPATDHAQTASHAVNVSPSRREPLTRNAA